jgi:hypothetical protein
MSLTKFVGLLAGSTLTLTSVSFGATEANNDTAAQINELKAEIAALKAQQGGEQWLTEQRAESIRGVVQDVLADSSTRSSFQAASNGASGYNGGFFIASGDWNLKINALEQVRFVWNNGYGKSPSDNPGGGTDNNQWGFENRRTQVFFSGSAFKDWKYVVGFGLDSQSDPYVTDGGVQLFYAYVQKNFGDKFNVKVGQQNVMFTAESQLFNAGNTQMGDYSIFDYMFSAGQGVGISAEAMLGDNFKVSGGWFNIVQHGNGADINQWNSLDNQGIALAARADFLFAGKWSSFENESSMKDSGFSAVAGLAVTWQNGRAINNNAATDPAANFYGINPFGITADVRMNFGGANLIGQFVWMDAWTSDQANCGFNIQGGYFFTNELEGFAALAYNSTADSHFFVQTGANWYFAGNNMKMTVMGIIPCGGGAIGDSLRGYEGGIGLADTNNNFSLVAQLQLMF